jgi:3-dehydroquinate dehydratase-2
MGGLGSIQRDATGQISGFGPFTYHLALVAMMQILNEIKSLQKAKQ